MKRIDAGVITYKISVLMYRRDDGQDKMHKRVNQENNINIKTLTIGAITRCISIRQSSSQYRRKLSLILN